MRITKTVIWKIECPKMFLHIDSVIIGASFLYGFLNKIVLTGGSVARASAANVSIIRFTQSI